MGSNNMLLWKWNLNKSKHKHNPSSLMMMMISPLNTIVKKKHKKNLNTIPRWCPCSPQDQYPPRIHPPRLLLPPRMIDNMDYPPISTHHRLSLSYTSTTKKKPSMSFVSQVGLRNVILVRY